MKKCSLHTVLWCAAGMLTLIAVVGMAMAGWIRYRKKQRLLGCSKDAMQFVGNMLLYAAGEKRQ
ncbi:MAG: hypothetical protein E7599_04575 [Ruminococcaceae bacterium]|nr:hypothetical protein [Oscillospiraceae bacterium]